MLPLLGELLGGWLVVGEGDTHMHAIAGREEIRRTDVGQGIIGRRPRPAREDPDQSHGRMLTSAPIRNARTGARRYTRGSARNSSAAASSGLTDSPAGRR